MRSVVTLLTASLIAAPAMAANPKPLSKEQLAGYSSTISKKHTKNVNAFVRDEPNPNPATDILVVNGTNSLMFTEIPGAFRDANNPEFNDHLTHDTMVGSTHINLQDPYGNTFFDSWVCRLAVVTVFGNVGSYRVNVDETYCKRPWSPL